MSAFHTPRLFALLAAALLLILTGCSTATRTPVAPDVPTLTDAEAKATIAAWPTYTPAPIPTVTPTPTPPHTLASFTLTAADGSTNTYVFWSDGNLIGADGTLGLVLNHDTVDCSTDDIHLAQGGRGWFVTGDYVDGFTVFYAMDMYAAVTIGAPSTVPVDSVACATN